LFLTKNMLKNISILNEEDIKSGKLITLIPELYDLKSVVENNDWHSNENVFDHTFSVLKHLKKIISELSPKTKEYLNEEIGDNTRKSLLIAATIFHDIGKKEVITDDGKFTPNHEEQSYEKAKNILKRFSLSDDEIGIVLKVIRSHGLLHRILLLNNHNFEKDITNFRKEFHDIHVELILLAYADTLSSYLKETRPVEFQFRINFYEKELKKFS